MAAILIVDDEPAIRKLLAVMFQEQGHAVYQASNGVEAINVLASKTIELMIIDIVMPEQGGIETIMKARENNDSLKIIVISGRVSVDNDAFQNLVKQYKVDRVFDKPFDKDVIYTTVLELTG
jgi:DNA-binding response OmpR family regulator